MTDHRPGRPGPLMVTRRRLLTAAAALLPAGAALPGRPAQAMGGPVGAPPAGPADAAPWQIYCDRNFPPYAFVEGDRLQGMDVDIVTAALEAGGIEATLHPVPWARALASLSEGVADMVFQLVGTPERFERFHMVGPMRQGTTVLVARADSAIEVPSLAHGSLADLAGLTVGTTQGFSYTPDFDAATHFVKDPAPGAELSLRKLMAKRVDLVIGDRTALGWLARRHGMAGQVRFLDDPVALVPRYAALPRDRSAKAERFAEALRRVQADGTVDRIIAHWRR